MQYGIVPQHPRHFCILLLPDKSMAPGETHPAGCIVQKKQRQQIQHLLHFSVYQYEVLKESRFYQ
jgi:hypothetical protein